MNECPFCGSEEIDAKEFYERTGLELEKTVKWNGEMKIILKLGELAFEGHKQNSQSSLDKERILQILQEEHKRIDQRNKELEENRRNIIKEQKEAMETIVTQREELEEKRKDIENQTEKLNKLKEEVIKGEALQLPQDIINKFKELQIAANVSNTEIKDLLNKMIHNVKDKGTLQETQLTVRLRNLNTGDKIDYLGGADQEDILITVKENFKELGSIKVDSKKVKKWDSGYLEQIKGYIKRNNTHFGLIATTAMPKNAAGADFYWEENILIVNQTIAEVAYLICRYLIIKNSEYQREFESRAEFLKENQSKLTKIKEILEKASFSKYLMNISEEIAKDNKNIDDLDTYFNRKLSSFRTSNEKIVKQVNLALDNNIELQNILSEESE